ncbi:MAG: DUF1573 domain-containing protein [Bacteroidales bacterium]|jgi:hypothetical protein|nr:DUF1573 domain-containing protein [Bacteroidales bacterium]
MKKFLLSVAVCCITIAQGLAQEENPVKEVKEVKEEKEVKKENPNAPEIQFEELVHDFETIEFKGKAEVDFVFTNVGKEPLTITQCSASCGCTAPTWTKEPVKPGEKGVVKVVYKNTNYASSFNKTVTVISNAKTNKVVLTIKGTVAPAKTE